LVFLAGQHGFGKGGIGQTALAVASAKAALPTVQLFFLAVLCNVLVCLAVWMSFGARSVADKVMVIVPPIAAFVAAGFEHSIANMYYFPLAMMLQAAAGEPAGFAWLWRNLAPVIAGNLVGGSVLVALVYYVIYRRGARVDAADA
jgi:formate/nitrite transporter